MTSVRHKRVGGFSGGMKRRVLLAQALLRDPKVLLLDEPAAGLDPRERVRIRDFIKELSKERIVLLATHIVTDIETIADKVLLMKKGRILRVDTPQALIDSLPATWASAGCQEPGGRVSLLSWGLSIDVGMETCFLGQKQARHTAHYDGALRVYLRRKPFGQRRAEGYRADETEISGAQHGSRISL